VSETAVAIIGAGPYGLSLATHLRARGVAFRIFGEAMASWRRMAQGMYLKSFGFATRIHTPQAGFSFVEYCRERHLESWEPCSIADFAEYGLWVQRQLVPELEPVLVSSVVSRAGSFELTLSTGEQVRARQAVVAVGVNPFPRLPQPLRDLSPALVSHTSQHHDFVQFAGKEVAVIGAGQSALEAAALLHERGARPQLLVRGPGLIFLGKMERKRSLAERLRAPLSVLGPGRLSWFLEKFPWAMYYAPQRKRLRLLRRHLGPSGSWWLRERLDGRVPVHTRCKVLAAAPAGGRIRLRLREEGRGEREVEVDHAVAGSGFEVDVDRLAFLPPELRARIARIERAPRLSPHFESSVPGLYFVGPASTYSFGPLFRFVAGAAYAAPKVANRIAWTIYR
jgi:cation diffusion facilitator CzcD-associated flavoprotein CzcO